MKYQVICTLMYNGLIEVEASNPDEAVMKADSELRENGNSFQSEIKAGEAVFDFGEATADYCLNEEEYE